MNPFLEQAGIWSTFHTQAMAAMSECLAPQVRPDYLVHVEAHLWIHERSADENGGTEQPPKRIGRGDVTLSVQPPSVSRAGVRHQGRAGLLVAPAQIAVPVVDIERQRYLEIRDRRNRTLITVVELLSPSNKQPGPDRVQYLAKRAEILAVSAHFVEIDLLRCGRPMPDTNRPECTYSALVSRFEERPVAGFWPIELRQPLPTIPIPLRPDTPDAAIDFQQILHLVYDRGTYADEIYEEDPDPPLSKEDADWARSLL
jgi:hypothetical protein